MFKKYSKLKFILCSIILCIPLLYLLCSPLPFLDKKANFKVRAAIDIGSGATKLKVAKIDLKHKKIDKVLSNDSFSVQYQEDLEKSTNGAFSQEVMDAGIDALKKSQAIAETYHAEKVVAVATASFRTAKNAEAFIDRIYKETGIEVHIIDQDLEGALGFEATAAQVDGDPKDIIVWDIGGGSFQFSTLNENGEIAVYRGVDASIPFKNRVIEQIKKADPDVVTTPNPLTIKEIHEAKSHAHLISSRIDDFFKTKITDPNTTIVGIGNIFSYRIYPLVDKKSHFTIEDLAKKMETLEGKHDKDFGSGDYTNVAATNPILVLGFMQTLGIDEMDVVDINNADGALLYPEFWDSEQPEEELSITV